METTKISLFQGKRIRKIFYETEWWFVIEDVVLALTDSSDPKQYIQRMKQRDIQLAEGWVQLVHTFEVPTEGGKQKMNCSNTEGVFRIIQSIPSRKAEPFKRWLARVGYERIQEIENPELTTKRTRMLYKLKGYPDDWIEKRMRGIAIQPFIPRSYLRGSIVEHPNQPDTFVISWVDARSEFDSKGGLLDSLCPGDLLIDDAQTVIAAYKKVRKSDLVRDDYSFQMEFGHPENQKIKIYQVRAFVRKKISEFTLEKNPEAAPEDSWRDNPGLVFGCTEANGMTLDLNRANVGLLGDDTAETDWALLRDENLRATPPLKFKPRKMRAYLVGTDSLNSMPGATLEHSHFRLAQKADVTAFEYPDLCGFARFESSPRVKIIADGRTALIEAA